MSGKKGTFIGLSSDCQCISLSQARQNFDQHPHKGLHEVLTEKQMLKKLTSNKISPVGCEAEKFIALVNSQLQPLITKLKLLQQQVIKRIKTEYFKAIVSDNIKISDDLIQSFAKMSNFQYEELKCFQINRVFTNINKNFKEVQLENKKTLILNKLKGDLVTVFNETLTKFALPKIIQSDGEGKKHSFVESEVKEFRVDSTQSSSSPLDQSSFSISSSSISSSNISIKFDQSSISQQQGTYINILDSQGSDQDISSFLKSQSKQKKEEKFSKKAKLCIFDGEEQQEKNTNSKKAKLEEGKQPNEKNQVKKEDRKKQQKKQDKKFEKKESREQNSHQKIEKLNPNLKSYVKQNEGKYYLRVGHLEKSLYRDEKATFHIKLKVVKILIFRLLEDKKAKKIYKKVKFIAGDETGVVVCYTNYLPEIKKNVYVVLNDCQLHKFYDSYEVSSNKCMIWRQNQTFGADTSITVSRFQQLEKLTYSMQKRQPLWPSVSGMSSTTKNPQLIAELSSIIYENQNYINCYLSDGTGTIYAVINKKQCPPFKIGSVYFFKKIAPVTQDQGKNKVTFLELSIQNKPCEMTGMSYDLQPHF